MLKLIWNGANPDVVSQARVRNTLLSNGFTERVQEAWVFDQPAGKFLNAETLGDVIMVMTGAGLHIDSDENAKDITIGITPVNA